jgi:predicted Zn-dependent protease
MIFTALFFDANASFGTTVLIELKNRKIEIKCGNQLPILWEFDGINFDESKQQGKKIVLKYGKDFPFQVLEIAENTSSFIDAFNEQFPNNKLIKASRNFFTNVSTKATMILLLGIVTFILISYFFLIPGIAEQVAKVFPKEYEIEMGNGIYSEMETKFTIDTNKSRLANEFFQTLQIKSEYPIEIAVVNDEVENAFALPGGHIVVYDKMFELMKSKEEFAALLSHEYSHVANKHTTRSLFKSLSTYLVVSLVLSDVNGITAVLIDNANQLKSLGYSRSLEQEADDKGLALMQEKGINPQGMIDLFKHLKSATASKTEIPEIISTHPDIENRIKHVQSKGVKPRKLQVDDAKLQQIWESLAADY